MTKSSTRRRPLSLPFATVHADGKVTIRAPYTALLRYRLLKDIPREGRRYDPTEGCWVVVPHWAKEGLRVFKAIFPDAPFKTGSGWCR